MLGKWHRGRIIGRGATAAVSLACFPDSGEVFAVKSVEMSRAGDLQREALILSTLESPYVVGYLGSGASLENGEKVFNLMMEYVAGGTLAEAVCRSGGGMDEAMIGCYVSQILKGLEYLHSRGIVHCDIKGSNVLLSNHGAKIADFGCAKMEGSAAIGGTPVFMAPEVARGEEQRWPADIWALGCTVIEMFTGNSPWPESGLHEIAFSGMAPHFPALLSDSARDFLSKCLIVDPRKRWPAKDLLQHPFLDHFEATVIPDETTSPTSILDHSIWSPIEEQVLQFPKKKNRKDLEKSPSQRMEELSVDSESKHWEWEESWVSVRRRR